jgi:hypothetical protein
MYLARFFLRKIVKILSCRKIGVIYLEVREKKFMVLSFILILLVALSGVVLTYFFAKDETLLWRISAGNVVGSALFGLIGFVIANFFGLSTLTALISLVISLIPLVLLTKKDIKHRFLLDWRAAKSRTQGISYKKLLRVLYYIGFFLLFVFFFDRAMYETQAGIFTGASQNLGDLPFHLGAIFGFADGNNFPPQNPSFANARFSYPFMSDLLTAFLMKFGADVKSVMLVQNVFWAFSLLVILERFVFKFTMSKLAGKIAPFLLFFSGGLGFIWFFKEFGEQGKSFFDFFWHLPTDYTIRSEGLRWGNSLNVLFITQRSLLLGMPLTIIVLQKLWEIFVSEKEEKSEKIRENTSLPLDLFTSSAFFIGLLAGTLPLIHLHSLAVLFIVTAFLFVLKPEKWREWIIFGVGVCVVAVPELVWSITDSATRTSQFFAWHFGWDKGKTDFFWFWLKNTGIFVPILALGIYLTQRREEPKKEIIEKKRKKEQEKQIADVQMQITNRKSRLLFYLPFIFLFIVSNTAKLAPWEWDNIKVLIYWFVGSLPFVALALAWVFERGNVWRFAASAALLILIFAGALDVWRVASGQVKIKVFDAGAVEIADDIRLRTPPNALFLNAPTYNSAVVLSGRRSLMRYIGHLSSHGIDYTEREADLKRIYEGNATADIFLRKYGIEYVLISPEERGSMAVNEAYFEKFPLVAEVGEYKVYKVK